MTHFKSILSLVRGGALRRGAATLGSGAAISLVLTYMTQIILTRLFEPGAFGVADSFVSLVAIVATFSSLRYEDAIMLPETSEQSRSVIHLASLLVVSAAALLLVFFSVYGKNIGSWLGSPELGKYLILIPVALIAHRANEFLELWHVRNKAYKRISTVQVVRTVATSSTRLTAGLTGVAANAGGLIWGFVVGFVVSTLLLVKNAKSNAIAVYRDFSFSEIRAAAKRYRRFPYFTMPANLLGALNNRLPFLLLLFFFDASVVGYFGRAFVSVAIPLSLVGTAVSRVFFVTASERVRDGDLSTLTLAVYDRLIMMAVLPLVTIIVAGPRLFGIVFGSDWIEAGQYARVLVTWFAIMGVASPLTRLFDVLERQLLDLSVSAISFVVVTAALVAGSLTNSIPTALLAVGVFGAITRTLQLVVLLHLGNVRTVASLKPWITYGLAAIPIGGLLYAARNSSDLLLVAALVVGLVLYGLLMLLFEAQRRSSAGNRIA